MWRLLVLASVLVLATCHNDEYSRKYNSPKSRLVPTQGQPWPKPQLMKNYGTGYMVVRPPIFRFLPMQENLCDMLEEALKRYYQIINQSSGALTAPVSLVGDKKKGRRLWKNSTDFHGYLDVLNIDLMGGCESYPSDDMDESYEIKIDTPDYPGEGVLAAATNWGILRGLETFSQLLHLTEDFTSLKVDSVLLVDYPRFPFRSVLLDTARHFLPKKTILKNLDLMAMNKYNVLHWHIVDDQSFPYQSKKFPALSEKGAYHQFTHIYTQKDIADVIDYARLRGIRVIPEFDSPGHTQAWGPGQPGLLTECYGKDGEPDGTFGPIDPTNQENYDFLKQFLTEVAGVFKDGYIHLGGDEVDFGCWKSNPAVQEFLQQRNFTDYAKVEEFYMQKLVKIVKTLPGNKSYIVWQEVIDNNVEVDEKTIVHVWKSGEYKEELSAVTGAGFRTLLSSCWYLNYISYGVDWQKYYTCDPHDFNGTLAQKRLVMGGGPAMWGEHVDDTNLIPRLWPRAAVPAERLWSNARVKDIKDATARLEEHRCRLLQRGFPVEPINGPGYCLTTWD